MTAPRTAAVALLLAFGAAVAASVVTALQGPRLLALGAFGDPAVGGPAGFTVGVQLDAVSCVLALLVTGVGAVVASYSVRHLDGEPRLGRYSALLVATVFSLTLAVTAASLPVLALGWVVAGWGLVALIGLRLDLTGARAAARRVLVTLTIGDVALVAAVAVLTHSLGSTDRASLTESVSQAAGSAVAGAAVLLAAAGMVRSAQVPAHRWLQETAAAPTPVSALLHAGLVNGAGLLAVLVWPVYAATPWLLVALVVSGAVTAAVGFATSAARPDVKGRLAGSTMAQMGFMTIQVGLAAPAAALFHLVGHGLFKSTLFLSAGGGIGSVRAGRRAPSLRQEDERPAFGRFVLSVALPTMLLIVLAATVAPPLHGIGSVVLWVAAATATGVILFTMLDPRRGISRSNAAALSAVTLGGLVAYVVALSAFERVVAPALGAASNVLATPIVAVLVAFLLLTGSSVWLVDRLVRQGRLTGVQLAALRTALPTMHRPARRHRVSVSPPTTISEPSRESLRRAVGRASLTVSQAWPLPSFVATNPLWNLTDRPFASALAVNSELRHARGTLDDEAFREAHARGRVTDDALDAALDDVLTDLPRSALPGHGLDTLAVARRLLLHRAVPSPSLVSAAARTTAGLGARAASLVATTDVRHGDHEQAAAIDTEVAWWMSVLLDEGTVRWSAPDPHEALFARWRTLASHSGVDGQWRTPGLAAAIATLPPDPADSLVTALHRMGVGEADWSDHLARSLARLPGWASHVAYLEQHAGPARPRASVLDLAAIRLTYESLLGGTRLPAAETDPRRAERLLADVAAAVPLTAEQLDELSDVEAITLLRVGALLDTTSGLVWLAAYEESFRTPLVESLTTTSRRVEGHRPLAQVVTCIDVRSEPMRRHLEAVDEIETFGFAGFFAVPFRHQSLDAAAGTDQCPVLVEPANTVAEVTDDQHRALGARAVSGRRALSGAVSAVHCAESTPIAPLSLAESLGWLYGPASMLRTLTPRAYAHLRAHLVSRIAPEAPTRQTLDFDGTFGFGDDQQVAMAQGALQTMGLTSGFARVVLFCGHGATVENNPFEAAYDCGACGGNPGGANARVLASLLNRPAVRQELRRNGIDIPADTVFLPAQHDTTRDVVQLLDADDAPTTHLADLQRLRHSLLVAGQRTALERVRTLPGAPTKATMSGGAAHRHAASRSVDWAQTRPEWGLAGNATFVVGPRSMTRDLDLRGRSFLHSYRWEDDEGAQALEAILTAPMVVAAWINAQYYFATVDPAQYGSGSKVVHNVVGGIGVLSGARGDLRPGLPWQGVARDATTLRHEPMRLLTVVHAPTAMIDEVIGRHPLLQCLFDNEWVSLGAIDPPSGRAMRRLSTGIWTPWANPLADSDRLTEPAARNGSSGAGVELAATR